MPVTVNAPVLASAASPDAATPVATFEPLPTKRFPLVSVVPSLLLNVFQSVEEIAPVVDVFAVAIDKVGLAPPVEARGAVTPTLVTDPVAAAIQESWPAPSTDRTFPASPATVAAGSFNTYEVVTVVGA